MVPCYTLIRSISAFFRIMKYLQQYQSVKLSVQNWNRSKTDTVLTPKLFHLSRTHNKENSVVFTTKLRYRARTFPFIPWRDYLAPQELIKLHSRNLLWVEGSFETLICCRVWEGSKRMAITLSSMFYAVSSPRSFSRQMARISTLLWNCNRGVNVIGDISFGCWTIE